MQRAVVVACVLVASADGAAFRGGFGMQPDVAARSFAALEDKWTFEAQQLILCRESNATSCDGIDAFQRSCGVVAKAVIQGSSGDKHAVGEYMGDVCGQATLRGWKSEDCRSFAQSVDASMTADQYQNREELNITSLCGNFWQKLLVQEGKRMQAARAASAAKAAEEARLAAEKAKKAAELRAKEAEAERAAQAEAARVKAEEAKRVAEEQRKKAEEAMRLVEAKKQEAVKAAEEARAALTTKNAKNATGLPTSNASNATQQQPQKSNATEASNTASVPTVATPAKATKVPSAANDTKVPAVANGTTIKNVTK